MSTRSPAMSVEDRRCQLEAAAVSVLRERGLAATTREIAAAADVAEGTIFRVFDCKDDLVQAALVRAFDPAPLLRQISDIDPDAPLRVKVLALVTAHQSHLIGLFELMSAVGMVRPPEQHHDKHAQGSRHEQLHTRMLELITPDTDQLRVPPEQLLRVLRMLTFSGSNPHISHGELLTPDDITGIVLDGALGTTSPARAESGESAC
ncbi:MAG: TetR/AcrR family transcriptional regulator [Ornithinimicrobium sp.]